MSQPSWLGAPEGGEMAGRIRAFPWDETVLGPISGWPDRLCRGLEHCLGSRFPMQIWWGSDLLSFYNDAFIPLLGRRHPESLGRAGLAVWPEAWSTFGPQAEAVMQRGESTWNERTRLVVSRNGFPEEAWFTWSHVPIRDESGVVVGVMGTYLEKTERVLAENSREILWDGALRQVAENRARVILENINEGFISLDRDWHFTYLNPQSLVLLGRSAEDLVGKNLWDEYPGLQGSAFEAVYRGVASTRQAGSTVAHFPDHQRWYEVRAYPAEDGGLSIYFRDVSPQKRADEENERLWEIEREARTGVERAGVLKDEFLATLSHELRTPLNAVLGWCEILNRAGPRSATELTDGLKTIERNARAQAQIIADILDMSSIIAGKMRVVFRPTDLAGILHEAISTARPAAEAKGIVIQNFIDVAGSRIMGDPNRLQQIFWNLLSNAVKFTAKEGAVWVRLERIESHLEVSVVDTGMGITPEFLPYVFDRFRQADASTTRQHGGLGLGLSIVKQLVELHGGTIAVQSSGLGHGAAFIVSLPLSAVEPAEEPAPARPVTVEKPAVRPLPEGGIHGVRVLVVDDEPDARALVKRLLEDYGAIVRMAASAQEAFDLLLAERPDVLVSDVGMPGEDGYSLIQRIRALSADQGGEIPAVALTAYARPEDRERSILAGFQMHLPKPVEPYALALTVAGLATAIIRSRHHLVVASLVLPKDKISSSPRRILLVEDHLATREAMKLLLTRRGHAVKVAGSLAEARTVADQTELDLVICDLGLPDGDGVDLMADLHARFNLVGIAVSGFDEEENLSRSRKAGFVAHLVKPVSIGVLEQAILSATVGLGK